jgi:hypothetical protein
MLIGAATRAAPREFAFNHDRGHATDAVLLRFGRYFGLVHVVDDYLMGRTS